MELLRGPGWRLVRKGRTRRRVKWVVGWVGGDCSDSALAYASSSIRKLANSLAAQRGRAGRTPEPTDELTQQGTIFLWISHCSRIIFREGKLDRRAYFIDGETCRRTQLKEMGSWRDSPGIFQKWLLLVSQAIEYLPLRSNPKIWRWCGPMTW